MIKLYDGGVYLLDGNKLVSESEAKEMGVTLSKDEAKKGTIAYSVLKAHNKNDDMSQLKIRFDAMTSHDITFVGIIQTAKASEWRNFPFLMFSRTVTTAFVQSAVQ